MLTRAVQLERGVFADFDSGGTIAAFPRVTTKLLDAHRSFLVARLDHVRGLVRLELRKRARAALSGCATFHGRLKRELVRVLGKQIEHIIGTESGVFGVPGCRGDQTTRGCARGRTHARDDEQDRGDECTTHGDE